MSRRFLRLGFGLSRTLVSEYILRLFQLSDVQECYFVCQFVNKRAVLYQLRWQLYPPGCWLYKCLCHHLPDVMLSVCVFSAGHIHCWNVSWWHSQSLRVNAFEFWNAGGPSELAKDWFVHLYCRRIIIIIIIIRAFVRRTMSASELNLRRRKLFSSVCGRFYSGLRSAMFRSVKMRVCLKLNHRVLKETSCPQ